MRLRENNGSPMANELSGSDGLDDSSEADEESELCSVLNKSVLNERQCQGLYNYQHHTLLLRYQPPRDRPREQRYWHESYVLGSYSTHQCSQEG